jgi:hypothetical protein
VDKNFGEVMIKSHADVLIATPGRSMEAEYVKSLIKTVSYLKDQGITYLFLNEYSSMVSSAREATTMGDVYLDPFNNSPVRGNVTYNKIFWIDSDIGWEVADFVKILESNKDIVSGLYFNEKMVPMFSVMAEDSAKEIDRILRSKKEEEIFAAGFGFIAMKQGVFEKMKRPWFESLFERVEDEETKKEIFIPYGEDFSWCKKARESGFKIYIDPTVRLSHYKKVQVRLDTYGEK